MGHSHEMVKNLPVFVFTVVFLLKHIENQHVTGLAKMTNIQCLPLDRDFAYFEYCYIKAVNRTYKYINLKVKLLKVPIDNITITIDVRKRGNGYKPFLYNTTVDACKFLRHKKNPLTLFFYTFLEKHSNMNHTCPYDHDLVVEKIDEYMLARNVIERLPVPDGEYALFTTWAAYNKVRAKVNFFGQIGRGF